jgi:hypothetical protein
MALFKVACCAASCAQKTAQPANVRASEPSEDPAIGPGRCAKNIKTLVFRKHWTFNVGSESSGEQSWSRNPHVGIPASVNVAAESKMRISPDYNGKKKVVVV